MDHRAIIASLTADQRDRLTALSNGRGLVHLILHFGAIALLGWLIAVRAPFWPLLIVPQGVLIIFLFTLLHETVHRTAFSSPWLNDIVARVCSLAILLPSDWFRYFHFAHHRFTQDPDNDPELATAKPETTSQYLVYVSGIPYWWSQLRTLVMNATGQCRDAFVPPKGRAKVRAEARIMIVAYALMIGISAFLQSTVLLYVWVLPAVLGQPFLRLYLLAEHGRCPYVANMLENSRTTLTNWLMRKLAWNMPYHAEHHSYPSVPFYRLPEFHALIKARLMQTETGYVRFHRKYLAACRELES